MDLKAPAAVLLAVPLFACASAGAKAKPGAPVDLRPARAAVEEARRAGAPQRVPDIFGQAEGHLRDAEALSAGGAPGADSERRAEILARLATAEAGCAADLARRYPKGVPAVKGGAGSPRGEGDVAARLRRSEEERRRAEERVALLQRELELTETEVIRTKARLQGNETKADASSAIAEARILIGRLDPRDRTTLVRSQELLAKAERQLADNNYGAAVFFAHKVQDMLSRPREAAPAP